MSSRLNRGLTTAIVSLGSGVASIVVLAPQAGRNFRLTRWYLNLAVSFAAAIQLENSNSSQAFFGLPASAPVGAYNGPMLEQGVSVGVGLGITLNTGGAGNVVYVVVEGYWEGPGVA